MMIDLYKTHFREFYIKHEVYNYYNNLIKVKNLETKNILNSTLSFQKSYFICYNEIPLKIMKTAFYFILKGFFRSQDI